MVHGFSQGHAVGRCSVSSRAGDAIRAGAWTSLRRIVAAMAAFTVGSSRTVTQRLAPRGEPHDPFRSRWATITGGYRVVLANVAEGERAQEAC